MKPLIFPVLMLLAALPLAPAHAVQLSNGVNVMKADDLQTRCITAVVLTGSPDLQSNQNDLIQAESCAAYFSALNETLMALRDGGVNPMGICYPPTPLPAVFAIKTFIAFVERHADAKSAYAMPVALAAMAEALPCYPGPKPK